MASLRKKNRTWFACITLADGSRTQRSTKQKDAGTPAERAEAKRRALRIAQEYEDAVRGDSTEAQVRKTVSDLFRRISGRHIDFARTDHFLNAWLARVKAHKAANTFLRYERIVRDFLESLGLKANRALGDITPQDVQAFLDQRLRDGCRPTSATLMAKVLGTPFNRALRQGLIISNPVLAVDVPEGRSVSREPFTWEQVRALLAYVQGDWRTMVMLGAYTGARLGDCARMTWGNVDLVENLIRFQPEKTQRQRKELVVPLHAALAEHLLAIAGNDRPEGFLCPTLGNVTVSGRHGLSLQFSELIARAGIENKAIELDRRRHEQMDAPAVQHAVPARADDMPAKNRAQYRYGFHSLRHTFNSMLANADVPQELRMAMTGHSSRRMNEIYTHREISTLREAMAKLPRET